MVGVATMAALTYAHSLRYYFSQDAFTVLAWVRGIEPPPAGAWRLLSGLGYFHVMDGLFGLNAVPYHVVTLALHALNAALTFAVGRRIGLSRGASALAAVIFGGHVAHFDAIFSVTGVGELMSAALIVIALLIALPSPEGASNPWRAWGVAFAYALALMCKETVLLFPLVLWALCRLEPRAARGALLPTAAIALVYVASFWLGDPFGLRTGALERGPYRPELGPGLLAAWATYVAWLFDTVWFALSDLTDQVRPHLEGWLLTALLVGLVGWVVWRRRRARPTAAPSADPRVTAALLGGAIFLCFIAPVLPLAAHAYHYYLYLPLVGIALIVAAALDLKGTAVRWIPWVAAMLVAMNGIAAVRAIERSTIPGTDMPSFGVLRRALIAERALRELGSTDAPLPSDLVLLGSHVLHPESTEDTLALARYLYTNLKTALDDGRAVRVAFPQVTQVTMAPDLYPGLEAPDVVVLTFGGAAQRGPSALLYLERADVAWSSGLPQEALASLDRAQALADRWGRLPAGPWRDRGLAGIRAQARRALTALEARPQRKGDATEAPWRAARERLDALARFAPK